MDFFCKTKFNLPTPDLPNVFIVMTKPARATPRGFAWQKIDKKSGARTPSRRFFLGVCWWI
jgi:hypothetical protein